MSNLANKLIIKGSLFLIFKQVFVQLIGVLSGILLTKSFNPEQFGYYSLYSFFFYLFLSIGDLGLGASTIKSKDSPSKIEYSSIFTFQFLLSIFILLLSCAIVFVGIYFGAFNSRYIYPFLLIPLASLLFSLQIVPTIMLERNLEFTKISFIEVVQTLAYIFSLIFFITNSYELYSVGLSWIVFSIIGGLTAYAVKPWHIKINLEKDFIKSHINFAFYYQVNIIINHLKNSFLPLFVGLFLGMNAVGVLNFAQMLVLSISLGLLVLQRLYYPVFSRLFNQNNKNEISNALFKYLIFSNIVTILPSIFVLIYAEQIIKIVFGEMWLVALPYAKLIWCINLLMPTTSVLTSFLQASGKSKTTFNITCFAIIISWALGVYLLPTYEKYGYVISIIFSNLFLLTLLVPIKEYLTKKFLLIPTCLGVIFLSLQAYM